MRRWLRNRKRWALRRRIVLHDRTLLRLYDQMAELEGRKQARLAALPVHMRALLEIEMERAREGRPEADALILAQIGVLR